MPRKRRTQINVLLLFLRYLFCTTVAVGPANGIFPVQDRQWFDLERGHRIMFQNLLRHKALFSKIYWENDCNSILEYGYRGGYSAVKSNVKIYKNMNGQRTSLLIWIIPLKRWHLSPQNGDVTAWSYQLKKSFTFSMITCHRFWRHFAIHKLEQYQYKYQTVSEARAAHVSCTVRVRIFFSQYSFK